MFTPSNRWLEVLLSRGLTAEALVDADDDPPVRTLDYLLSQAVKRGLMDRVSLLVTHGADVDGIDVYSKRTNYQNAVLGGFPEIAKLLVEGGATVTEFSPTDRFRAAIMCDDSDTAKQLLDDESGLIDNPDLLVDAVDNVDATRLLLDLGADPNAPNKAGRVALHEAAWSKCWGTD